MISYVFFVLLVLLTIFGMFGNLMVIIAIGGDRKMRKAAMNILLINLAVADLLNLIILSIEWSQVIIFGRNIWILPGFLCPIVRYLECLFLFSSIMTQLIVCVERYVAIVYPMQVRRVCSVKNILIAISIMWLCVFLVSLPNAFCNRKRSIKIGQDTITRCSNRSIASIYWYLYKWVEFLSFYLIPCIIIIVLYCQISKVLWTNNKLLQEGKCFYSKINYRCSTAKVFKSRSDTVTMRRSVVKMLVTCVSVYFVCYSPIQFLFLFITVFKYKVRVPFSFRLCMNVLALTCSACNPLLYTLFSKKFRSKILNLLPNKISMK
uniref:G_PROTEIN_RECEP_F1_2 domain-containing protein n=1 Tax=Syphacia muris TaxID=451379 RepID=A0A0N5AP81_9BILA